MRMVLKFTLSRAGSTYKQAYRRGPPVIKRFAVTGSAKVVGVWIYF
jgi:hypothetical protein